MVSEGAPRSVYEHLLNGVPYDIPEEYGSSGHVDLFDPDTGDTLHSVPVAQQAQQMSFSHTAFCKLMDRVAMLEKRVYAEGSK